MNLRWLFVFAIFARYAGRRPVVVTVKRPRQFLRTQFQCIICRHDLNYDTRLMMYVHRGNNRVWRYWPFDHVPMWRPNL